MSNKRTSNKNNKEEDRTTEIKRYLGAMHEDYSSKLDVVIEHFGGINEKLDSHTRILDSYTEMIGKTAENIEIIKNNIEFLKGGIKKKVDYDEFQALEKRMSLLESKMKR
ncbi:MAG: hypothetical protein AAB488_00995 [Patescibacteria group bacterium]